MNASQFNKLHKGTRLTNGKPFNSATDGGLLLRHHNYIERDVKQVKKVHDFLQIFTPAATQLQSEFEYK